MSEMKKFPRTRHIRGSRFQHGDDDLEAVPWEELAGKHLLIEEKIDGANVGISFVDGEMKLQSRGHYLHGGPREKQFELLKQWAATHEMGLYEMLGERYVMYGEWMFACHTIWYDRLPHYFMEFDVFDRETDTFLSTPARDELLRRTSAPVRIVPVRVIATGLVSGVEELKSMIGPSAFVSEGKSRHNDSLLSCESSWYDAVVVCNVLGKRGHYVFQQDEWIARCEELRKKYYVGPTMEGLYVKWEKDGIVKGRYKFVRDDFVSHIAGQDEHWHDRPILQNGLIPGALEHMFRSDT